MCSFSAFLSILGVGKAIHSRSVAAGLAHRGVKCRKRAEYEKNKSLDSCKQFSPSAHRTAADAPSPQNNAANDGMERHKGAREKKFYILSTTNT